MHKHGLSDGPRKRACLFILALRAQRSTAQAPGCENDTKLTAATSRNDLNKEKLGGHLRCPLGPHMDITWILGKSTFSIEIVDFHVQL